MRKNLFFDSRKWRGKDSSLRVSATSEAIQEVNYRLLKKLRFACFATNLLRDSRNDDSLLPRHTERDSAKYPFWLIVNQRQITNFGRIKKNESCELP